MQKWLVKEGEEVEEFQNLADVSTDKLFTQIPSTEKGKIHKLYVKEGDPCQVGSVLLELEVEDEAPAANAKQPATATITSNTQDCPLAADKQEARSTSPGGKVLSTPVVREYAKQKGIIINLVVGTGAEGRVTKQDVDNFKPGQQTQKPHSPRIEIGVDMYQDMLATPAVRSFATDNRVDISQVKVLSSDEGKRQTREDPEGRHPRLQRQAPESNDRGLLQAAAPDSSHPRRSASRQDESDNARNGEVDEPRCHCATLLPEGRIRHHETCTRFSPRLSSGINLTLEKLETKKSRSFLSSRRRFQQR